MEKLSAPDKIRKYYLNIAFFPFSVVLKMAAIIKREMDQHNEELREDIPELPNIANILQELITVPKIHAAYLYTPKGWELLQTLCLWLSGTKSSYHYGGWEDFGIKLGLQQWSIKSIKYSLNQEDPTTYILLAYVQRDDATIEQILHALYEIKRHDILLKIKDLVKNLYEEILRGNHIVEEIDMIKPASVPNCPFIFKNVDKLQPKIFREMVQKSTPFTREPKANHNLYTKTVLLTYSSDADQIVQQCLVKLRQSRNDLRLGIVVLNEHRNKLNDCPEQFIFECFAQVDYIFPIITLQYLKDISNITTNIHCSALENPDHKYAKYIYRLMTTHYLRNGCRNTLVRCLIPDNIVKQVVKDPAMGHSMFQIWVRIKEIEMLLQSILKSAI